MVASVSNPITGTHRVASRLSDCYRKMLAALEEAAQADEPIVSKAVSYFMNRKGKLLRPTFTLLCCEISGGNPTGAVDLAAAVELVHCSSIILDDLPCMDNTPTRREQPSLHVRFGEAIAILTSVHFLSQAFRLVGRISTPESDLTAILSEAISRNGMISGQAMDLKYGGNADEIRSLKTAPLFRVAARFGAHVARASASHVQALTRFSNDFSLVFQIKDDLLDEETHPSTLERAKEVSVSAAADLVSTFGLTPPSCDLVELMRFAVSRSC